MPKTFILKNNKAGIKWRGNFKLKPNKEFYFENILYFKIQ